MARLSVILALVLGFCSSGYDFAIPSSRLYLAVQTLGVAMRFVGNYAPYGLSPQMYDMPVIRKMEYSSLSCTPFCYRQESCSVGKSLQLAVSVEHDFKEHDVSATFIDMTSVFDFFKNHGASGNGRRPICCELQEALQGCFLFAEVYRHS